LLFGARHWRIDYSAAGGGRARVREVVCWTAAAPAPQHQQARASLDAASLSEILARCR